MSTKSKYTWKGDTWYLAGKECPRCDTELASNSRIVVCNECEYWVTLPGVGDE